MMVPARGHIAEVGSQRGRVHGHEDARVVPGGQDVVVGYVDLESGHAGQGPGRGPDLGREVREGGQVVAKQGRGGRETVPGQLHAVAGIAGKADDGPVQVDYWTLMGSGIGHRFPSRGLWTNILRARASRLRLPSK